VEVVNNMGRTLSPLSTKQSLTVIRSFPTTARLQCADRIHTTTPLL